MQRSAVPQEDETSASSVPEAVADSTPRPVDVPDAPREPRPAGTGKNVSGGVLTECNGHKQELAENPNSTSKPALKCSSCGQSPSTHLLRCSKCKVALYCDQQCQRKHWQEHKRECKSLGRARAKAGVSGEIEVQGSEASTGVTSIDDSPEGAENGVLSMPDAIQAYLQQDESSKTDLVEKTLETGVLTFVRGDYKAAIQHLQSAYHKAGETGRQLVAGDALRWLGHAYCRISDSANASKYFMLGHREAKRFGNRKLQVDCLSGLGCMCRAANQVEEAEAHFRQALQITEDVGGIEMKASVLCNLGATLVNKDPQTSIVYLEEAVELRKQQIVDFNDSGRQQELPTVIMEHASALVNLASAQYCNSDYTSAQQAYEEALQVFELIEDADKVAKVLINLANMNELQLHDRVKASGHRRHLFAFLRNHGGRAPPDECCICLDPINVLKESPVEQPLIVIACYHCFHNKCWASWSSKGSQDPSCPSCKQPVPLY